MSVMPQRPGESLVGLARRAVRAHLEHGFTEPPPGLIDAFAEPAGVFVTIRRRTGELRGCVGTTQPVCASIPDEVIRVAPLAATKDYRFPPIETAELPSLRFEVSVLTPQEPVSGPGQLDPHRYGVTIEDADGRRALLLPSIPTIDTVDVQLREVRKKAGIGPEAPVSLWRFEVTKFTEP